MLDHSKPYFLEFDGFSSDEECDRLIALIEREGTSPATINSVFGIRVDKRIRDVDRLILDDQELADDLFSRMKDRLPTKFLDRELYSLNERFRFYKYSPGMMFKSHQDGYFERNSRERSYYTVLIYLNEGFEGGETSFATSPEKVIVPKTGLCAVFQHPIIHSGDEVVSGIKYVLRTDVMYRLPSKDKA